MEDKKQKIKIDTVNKSEIDIKNIEEYANSDGINPLKYYSYHFKKFPNKLNFDSFSKEFAKKIEKQKIFYDQNKFIKNIKKKFPDANFNFNYYVDEKLEVKTLYLMVIIDSIETIAYIDSNDNNGIIVYFNDVKNGQIVFKEYIKSIVLKPIESQQKNISLIVARQGGYDLIESKIKQVEVNINKHYNDDFKKADKVIKDFIEEDNTSGLVILNGVKGTGKTTYIRHLINTSDRRFIYLTKEMASALTDPGFIGFLTEIKDSVLVIEDCENLVAARNQGNSSTGISNLLNLCDGLLSDVFNIKIIATFNEDIAKVDSALLRKGRLIYHYEFKELCLEKTNKLFKSLKSDYVSEVPMTLADIFNHEKDNGELNSNKKKTIGFN